MGKGKIVKGSLLARIREIERKETKTLEQLLIKLQEESGELAEVVLQMAGKKGCDKSEKALREARVEEAADCAIVCLTILARCTDNETIKKMIDKKLTKREKQLRDNA